MVEEDLMEKLRKVEWNKDFKWVDANEYRYDMCACFHEYETDIEKYIEMDKDVKNLAEKLSAQEVVVEYLQNTLNTMRDRSYSVQAAIKMRIFLSGG